MTNKTSMKNILVIDDEKSVRRLFESALKDSGYHLVIMENGEKGVEEFLKNEYQLVFLDLKMDGMSGVDALKKIRQHSLTVPVYVATVFQKDILEELDEVRRDGLEFQLVRKPLSATEIMELTQSVLEL